MGFRETGGLLLALLLYIFCNPIWYIEVMGISAAKIFLSFCVSEKTAILLQPAVNFP